MVVLLITGNIAAQNNSNEKVDKEKGYFNLTSVSAILGSENPYFRIKEVVPSFTMVNGYNLNKNIGVGIGVGAELYNYAVFPIFADIRYKLNRKGFYPFFALKAGYGVAESSKTLDYYEYYPHYYAYDYSSSIGSGYYYPKTSSTNKGGLMFSPEVGIYVPLLNKLDMTISVGYRYQQLESKRTINSNGYYGDQSSIAPNPDLITTDKIKATLNRFTLSVGFQFR